MPWTVNLDRKNMMESKRFSTDLNLKVGPGSYIKLYVALGEKIAVNCKTDCDCRHFR